MEDKIWDKYSSNTPTQDFRYRRRKGTFLSKLDPGN
jgi:hypothetical protein